MPAKLAGCYETCLPSIFKLLKVILFILLMISLIVQTLDIAFLQLENGCPTFERPHFRWALIVPMLFGICALIGLLVASHETRTFCLIFFICGIVLVEVHIYREVKRGSVRWISGGCGHDMTQFQLALVYFWFTEAILATIIVCLDFCLESYAYQQRRRPAPLSLGAASGKPTLQVCHHYPQQLSRQPGYHQLMAPLPSLLPPGRNQSMPAGSARGFLAPPYYQNQRQQVETVRFISPTQAYATSLVENWTDVHGNSNHNCNDNNDMIGSSNRH